MAGAASRTILVVDDDASLRMLCRINLEFDGYRVLEAASIAEARQSLAEDHIDAMLLDVHLRDGHGRVLLDSLGDRRPRVAFFTGSGQIGPDLRALVDDVLPKPFTLDALATTVDRLVAGY
jgi:DNA-binding NtrC family response regulator